MQVAERVYQTSTHLEINYISRPARSFVMTWLLIGVFLISLGCFGLWYSSTQVQVGIQLTCERTPSEINCRLDSSTFIEQRSQELKQLQTVQLRQPRWMEYDYYQIVFIAASGEVITIVDNNRPSLEGFVNQVNGFIHSSRNRTLTTSYGVRWKRSWLVGFAGFWLIGVLLIFPSPLFGLDFRYTCVFDKMSNQATAWSVLY